ncbi:unnamed protein product [Peronospora destructor]|uniref:SAC3/GANP/THP3 conserved domain-containing protein n=1 Tax=Peronospora destructor TaxID=86335 RepID=A0AAV0UCP5_9STRA|nr:unnamed protein product [Peronospora destructor]
MPIRGECQALCPLSEKLERIRTHELSRFERPTADFQGLEAIKQYRRAAAGRDVGDASEWRPASILLRTLRHLFTTVLSWPQSGFDGREPARSDEFLAVYHFVNDRIRSVRQDFTVQRIEDASLVTALQQIARFHLLARLRSMQLLKAQEWSNKLNDEQLTSALSQLQGLYHIHEFLAEHEDVPEVKEAGAFVAYNLLLHADDPQNVAWMLRKSSLKLRATAVVQRALRTFVALQTDDFAAFFTQLNAMTLLEKAASLHHLGKVWTRSLRMINKSFGKQERFPLEELARWMNLVDPHREHEGGEHAERLCNALNIQMQRHPPPPLPTRSDTGSVAESWEQVDDGLADQVVSLPVTKPSSLGFAQFKLAPLHDQLDSDAAGLLLRDAALRIENNSADKCVLLTTTQLIMGTAQDIGAHC